MPNSVPTRPTTFCERREEQKAKSLQARQESEDRARLTTLRREIGRESVRLDCLLNQWQEVDAVLPAQRNNPELRAELSARLAEHRAWCWLALVTIVLGVADVSLVLYNFAGDLAARLAFPEPPSARHVIAASVLMEILVISVLLLFKRVGEPAPYVAQREAAITDREYYMANARVAGAWFARGIYFLIVLVAFGLNFLAERNKAAIERSLWQEQQKIAGAPGARLAEQLDVDRSGTLQIEPAEENATAGPAVSLNCGILLLLASAHICVMFLKPGARRVRSIRALTIEELEKMRENLQAAISRRLVKLDFQLALAGHRPDWDDAVRSVLHPRVARALPSSVNRGLAVPSANVIDAEFVNMQANPAASL